VTRLGLRQIHNLAQTVSLQAFCDVGQGIYRRTLGLIWQRSVARAVSMRALCDLLDPQRALDGDNAYLIGLMSDVGASLLLWMAAERSNGASEIGHAAGEYEEVMGMVRRNHEGLSAALVESWKFETLVGVCTGRHHQDATPPTHPLWWSLQVLGEHLASRLVPERDVTSERIHGELAVERSAMALCIPRSVVDHLVDRLGEEMVAIRGDEMRA
jgi:HD-like signal output (HDOD) protein